MKPGLVGWSVLGHVVIMPRHSPIPAPFAVVSTKHHGERQMGSRRHRTKSTIAYPASTVAAALRPVAGLRVGLAVLALGAGAVASVTVAWPAALVLAVLAVAVDVPTGPPFALHRAAALVATHRQAPRRGWRQYLPLERAGPEIILNRPLNGLLLRHAARDGGHPHRGRGGRRRPCGGAVRHVRMPGTPGASIRTHEGARGLRAARRSTAGSCRGDARERTDGGHGAGCSTERHPTPHRAADPHVDRRHRARDGFEGAARVGSDAEADPGRRARGATRGRPAARLHGSRDVAGPPGRLRLPAVRDLAIPRREPGDARSNRGRSQEPGRGAAGEPARDRGLSSRGGGASQRARCDGAARLRAIPQGPPRASELAPDQHDEQHQPEPEASRARERV